MTGLGLQIRYAILRLLEAIDRGNVPWLVLNTVEAISAEDGLEILAAIATLRRAVMGDVPATKLSPRHGPHLVI